MKRTILTAIIILGSTIAHAQPPGQPNVQTTNSASGSDPLSVPTSSSPSASSSSPATTSGSAMTTRGGSTVSGSPTPAGGSASGISASSSSSAQAPLELPGE